MQQPAKKQKRSGAGLGSILSPAMQAFLGCETMPRPQVGIYACTQATCNGTGCYSDLVVLSLTASVLLTGGAQGLGVHQREQLTISLGTSA